MAEDPVSEFINATRNIARLQKLAEQADAEVAAAEQARDAALAQPPGVEPTRPYETVQVWIRAVITAERAWEGVNREERRHADALSELLQRYR